MIEFCSLLPAQLKKAFKDKGLPTYRAQQLLEWVYKKGVLDYDKMTNLPQALRSELEKSMLLPALKRENVLESSDKETTKFLFKLKGGELVETVLIRSGGRRTVCISSQVGCPARCAFCASGKQGLIRNLSAAEIVEQVLQVNLYLKEKNESVSHLVFMGMGEPLENLEAVLQALKIFLSPDTLNLSSRKVTISTVGVIEGIDRLLDEGLNVNLALSLHAPNQHLRKKIIPYARKYPLDDLLKSVEEYGVQSKRDVTYEYILLAGINDSIGHAKELAHLLRGKQCCVNLIPYNPVDGLKLKRPAKDAIEEFRSALFESGVRSTRRYTKGKDIDAACGQLALKNQKRYKEQTQNIRIGS